MTETKIERQLVDLSDLLGLYRHWRSKRRGRRMPGWKDFDPVEMRVWLGNLNLAEFEETTGRYRYRVFGSNIAGYIGIDLTGKYVDEGAADADGAISRSYDEVRRTGKPLFVHHEQGPVATIYRHNRLLLPLGEDGVTATKFLVGVSVARAKSAIGSGAAVRPARPR